MTERLLVDAGVGAGMRVLDVGCGMGDVSLLVARLVGEQGQVLGVDRDPRPLVVARKRASELNLSRVAFAESDLSALSPEHGEFDCAVGRRVLMYQPDPVDAIRRLADALRPGGLVVFQEHDSLMGPASRMPLPLHERVHGWMWRTIEREGANIHMGFDLASVLEQAGLIVEQVRAEAIVQTPTAHRAVGPIIRAMLLLDQIPNPLLDPTDSVIIVPQLVLAGVSVTDPTKAAQIVTEFGPDTLVARPGESGLKLIEIGRAFAIWRGIKASDMPHAIILRTNNEGRSPLEIRFSSLEAAPAQRPRLRISYTNAVPLGLP